MTRRYKLLKDLPDIESGSFIQYDDKAKEYYVVTKKESRIYFQEETVEANKDWFELIPEEVKVDWEVVKYWNADYWRSPTEKCKSNGRKIASVLRISDNTTFSIGDEVEYTHQLIDNKYTFIIGAIDIVNENDCFVWRANQPSYLRGVPECSISSLRKVKDDSKPTSTKPEQEPNDISNFLIDKYGVDGIKRVFYDVNPCPICGGQQVLIRGRNPGEDKRPACATCSTERLEQINQISDRHYGKACKQG